MPVEHSFTVPDARRRTVDAAAQNHSKSVLYAKVYDPFTALWFAALDRERPEVDELLARTTSDLKYSLEAFNELFHRLVDECVVELTRDQQVVDVLIQHKTAVVWFGHMVPPDNAAPMDVIDSLRHKFSRNISLGAVEALICLESAYTFAREELNITGDELERVLRRSRQLYRSLAALHDEQERVRLTYLTGREGYLAYPDVDYEKVLKHVVFVEPKRFVATTGADGLRLRFRIPPIALDVELDSPIMRCPAHRLPAADQSCNDRLWDLLLEIYRAGGRFG